MLLRGSRLLANHRPATAAEHIAKLQTMTGLEKSILARVCSAPDAVLERRVLQSAAFRSKVLEPWALHMLKTGEIMKPKELVRVCPVETSDPELRWFLKKIASSGGPIPKESPGTFPSALALAGPQFPFSPQELDHLQRKFGSINGREMTKPLRVQRNSAKLAKKKETRSFYDFPIEDDNDKFKDDPLHPKSTRF